MIWDWVDSISFQLGDLDHLVVMRAGGLVSAQKAQHRAEALARTLLTKGRGAHRARVQATTATPVVVVWGAAQRTIPPDAIVEGVRFVSGRELVSWLRTVSGDPVPKDAARDVVERLKAYRATAWQDV